MSWYDALSHRMRALLRRDAYDRELQEEMQFHLALEAEQQRHAANGSLGAREAAWLARRHFGNVTQLEEERRVMAGLGFWDVLRQDISFALRSFRRTPAFSAVVIGTLAIGIGANTAIFSAVNAMILRPLPFRKPERLMSVSMTMPARGDQPATNDQIWSYPKFNVARSAQHVFSDVAVYMDDNVTVSSPDGAQREESEIAGARYFATLGVQPALGRAFLPDEDVTPGSAHVVLLADAYWKRRFNADSAVLGKQITVNAKSYEIVGVLPAGFKGLSGKAMLWLPLMSLPDDWIGEGQAWSHSFNAVGRLRAGVTPQEATLDMQRVGRIVDQTYPHPEIKTEHWGATAKPLDASRIDPLVRQSLLVLLGAVALVLLIACANVANLFLVRASGRRREIAVRLAIGAGRRRLMRQLLTEGVLLSVVGGALGMIIAWWGVKLLAALDPSTALRARRFNSLGAVAFSSIHLDWVTFAFAFAMAVVTGLLFGLVPALRATRPTLSQDLKDGKTETPAKGRGHWSSRNLLAAADVALALVLLAGAGVTLRSLSKLMGVSSGIDPTRLMTVRISTPENYSRDSLPQLYEEMLERVQHLPGVVDASITDCPPMNGGCNGTVMVRRNRPEPTPGTESEVGVHWIAPSWTSVVRASLKSGRLFDQGDRKGAPKVVLINETAARRLFPGEDPLGRPVSVGQGGFWKDTAHVVGVVSDIRYGSLDSPMQSEVYLPYAQSPNGRLMLFVRTSGDPKSVVTPIRRLVKEISPESAVHDARTMEERIGDSTTSARFSSLLLSLFAIVALLLAAIGTYGVISFNASQRVREMGIRVALGATRRQVAQLVVGEALGIALAGGTIGVTGALGATRLLRALLYDVSPNDPITFVVIVVLLAGTVLLASWLPARRASRVAPQDALRSE